MGGAKRDAAYVVALDVLVPRIAAEATRRPRLSSVMPTFLDLSRPQLCVSWPSGLLAVALVVWLAGNVGRWLGMVVLDTLGGYVSNKGDVADVNARCSYIT